jgi:hypothetical protein
MNLFSSRLVLRPRQLTEVLDLALPFCLACARPLARMALAVLAPLLVLAGGLRLGLGWAWPAVWAVIIPLAVLGQGAFTVTLGEALFKAPTEIQVAPLLWRFLSRLPALVTLQLTRLVVLLACASVLVPVFTEGPRWSFITEATLLERAGPGPAIGRSRALARDRMGFCLGLALALLALPVLTMFLADLMGNSLLGFVLQLGQPLGALDQDGGSALALVGLLLGMPLAACARFLGYIDLRTRKEGWDIQLRFTAWAERAATTSHAGAA